MKEYPTKFCEYCGKEFNCDREHYHISLDQWAMRKYCSRQCGNKARKREIFTPSQIEFLREQYKLLGRDVCAERIGIAKETLVYKIKNYETEHGPISFECEKAQPREINNDIATVLDIGIAAIECNWVLNTWRNQVIKGRVGLKQ